MKAVRRLAVLLPLFLLAACAAPFADRPGAPALFTLDGAGPWRIGMDFADVPPERIALEYGSDDGDTATGRGCETFSAVGQRGLGLMFEDGRLARIDAYRPFDGSDAPMVDARLSAAMLPGKRDYAPIGASVEDAQAALGGALTIEPHPYLGEAGAYLVYRPEDRSDRALIMESEHDVITSFRVGTARAAGYIEGCL